MTTVESSTPARLAGSAAGYRLRNYQGEADLPLIHAIVRASREADGIQESGTLAELVNMYTHLVNCDLARDLVFVEVPGEPAPVAYGRNFWVDEANGPRLFFHLVYCLTEWRGRGLEDAVLAWQWQRIGEIVAEQGYTGEAVLQTEADSNEPWRIKLFEANGYQVVRYGFMMRRDLGQPVAITPLPEGVTVRPPATPEEVRAVWLADVEAFRDHWGYVEPTETDYQGWLSQPTFNPALWMVAWDAATGEVAGQVQNYINQEENEHRGVLRGYTEGISVRRPWRRQGLARALLTRSLLMFQDMGFAEAALGVDAENLSGALNLYQSVGFREMRRSTTYRKPLALEARPVI